MSECFMLYDAVMISTTKMFFVLCHFVLIYRTNCVLCCIMLSWSLEHNVFCVVSCCLDNDTNLMLKFSKIYYFAMLCPSGEIETNSRRCNFIMSKCFMLYHVFMISRTKCVLCCVILSWYLEEYVFYVVSCCHDL